MKNQQGVSKNTKLVSKIDKENAVILAEASSQPRQEQ